MTERAYPLPLETESGRAGCMPTGRVAGPHLLVIFGGTGDLSRRKLVPALYRLFRESLLPEAFAIVGVAREPFSDGDFRSVMHEAVTEFAGEPEPDEWHAFAERLHYVGMDFADPAGFSRLAERLSVLDEERGTGGSRLYYLAVPPGVVPRVVERMARAGMVNDTDGQRWTRVVVEKPFGRDLESARELNRVLLHAFDEEQVYRIDHYLGKETVQNLLVFRFANVVWEPVWNRQYVDHVQVSVAESVGVEQRAGYYEGAGALRDMVQNHLLQLLMLVAMEPPAAYTADAIRDEKVKVLSSVRPIPVAQVQSETARGQYGAGAVAGDRVPAYRKEPGVDADSRTETFAALRLWIDNWRWAGVPFYLRTGKRLPARVSEIVVHFRPAPHPILDVVEGDLPAPNVLTLRVQPDEGISLRFEAKVPGLAGPLHPVEMNFSYRETFEEASPEAYERLLLDAMVGDPTLFARRDEVEAAWALMMPILRAWDNAEMPELESYPAGTWGPPAADALIAAGGRRWRVPEA